MADSAKAAAEAAAAKAAARFIQEVWGLQGTAYLIVAIRYYARIKNVGWRGLDWDDGLMVLATFVYTAESVMAYFVVAWWQGLANNAMTDEQRASLDPNSEEWAMRVGGSKTHVVGLLLYTTLLWILKGCWLVYYGRLTDGVTNRRRLVQVGSVMALVTYVACLLVAFLKCIPFHHQWQISPSPGNRCMPAISTLQTIFVMVMNTITDFYLMAIPLPVIWQSQLPWRKKLVLLIMFSGGLLEMIFGIMRAVSILTLGNTDPAQSGYWSVRESFVSYVLTNLPMVYPLFRNLLEKSINRSKGATYGSRGAINSKGYQLDSMKGSRNGGATGNGSRIQRTLNRDTEREPNDDEVWGSKDNIVVGTAATTASSDEERSMGGHQAPPQPGGYPSTGGDKNGSLDLPRQQPTTPQPQPHQQRRQRSTSNAGRNGNPRQIVVTKEYTITESGNAGDDGGARSGGTRFNVSAQ